ncbi:MAG: hypothetical protein M0P70_16590 [Desulfobulbaceae bacterium]|nr:hypothetical protein [Desulfobulbaceae bacterium]
MAKNIRLRIEELRKVCKGVDERTASRAPTGKWSPREILSHLLGPEGTGHLQLLQAFLQQETPRLDVEAENPFFSESRARMSFTQLFSEVERAYEEMAKFSEGLSKEQLDRTAQIPMLKGTPFGEFPTLETWIGLLGGGNESHLQFHTSHLREILQKLAGAE